MVAQSPSKKQRLEIMRGRKPEALIREIFCKKTEDFLPVKKRKKLVSAFEEYAAQYEDERSLQRLQCRIAAELLALEVDSKNPLIIEYVVRPGLAFYNERYA